MGMFKQILEAVYYSRAAAHFNAGRYDSALRSLRKIQSQGDVGGKKVLFIADIFHRKGDFMASHNTYVEFLESDLAKIEGTGDRNYLRSYAKYFAMHAGNKAKLTISEDITLVDVRLASSKASKLSLAEFPPP